MRTRSLLLILALAAACGGDDESVPVDAAVIDTAIDAPVDAAIDAGFVPPTMLSQTGLYSDIAAKTIAPGVHEFLPRWQLWSDDAVKRRWIYLPPGATIDSADMDHWRFPIGTKLWKEFVRDGKRIETRFLEKIGPGNDFATDWFVVSFQWDAAEADGTAVPAGVVDDLGHNDIPARSQCRQCHSDTRVPSVVIGFSALLLDDPAVPGYKLADLVAESRLTVNPPAPVAGHAFPLPSSDGTAAAIGYLHVNCGNCHNAASDLAALTPVRLRLSVGQLATWEGTSTWTTTVDQAPMFGVAGATAVIEPGVPAQSALYYRITATAAQRMPPLGREVVDPTGTEAVRAWIAAMPPTP